MNIPVLNVEGDTIPEAWENAVIAVSKYGIEFETEYDREGDPLSLDCTMIMTINCPQDEPKIHRCFPGSLEDLETYRREVVDGISDYKVTTGKWSYSYHDRLANYPDGMSSIDQLETLLDKLAESPYTRRAQAITWVPSLDAKHSEPPCLQRLWFRALPNNGGYSLNMNLHWRSRDSLKAALMNLYALASLQKKIADYLQERTSKPVSCGRIVDISDSFHVYGKDLKDLENLLRQIEKRPFALRTWLSSYARESDDN